MGRIAAPETLLLVLALQACASRRDPRVGSDTAPVQQASATLPSTPAAVALGEWLRIYNLGMPDSARAFAARAYTPGELAARPPEAVARGQQLWRMNYGRMQVVSVDSSTPFAIEATVSEALTEAHGKIFVEVDTAPPHQITGVWLIPFVDAPTVGIPAHALTDQELARALERYARRLEQEDVLSGAALVARRGKVIFAGAFGTAAKSPAVPNTLDTRFELASLSKLFTAVAIAQLVERGSLAFNTPVSTVLPDYPRPDFASRITVTHLLTHTSGLPDFYRNGKFRLHGDSLRSLGDFLIMFAHDSLWSQPGERYDYSNSNYIVLGLIIERITGSRFEDYIARNIFTPAGMTRTCYCDVGASDRATPYSRYTAGFGPTRRPMPDRWVEVPPGARRPGAPTGGGISTVGDLARFAQALLDHRLVSAEMTAQMLTPRVPMEDGGSRGLGFEVYQRADTRFVGHGGNFWGTMSQLDIYPDAGVVVVVLSNNDASGGEAVRSWTRRILTSR